MQSLGKLHLILDLLYVCFGNVIGRLANIPSTALLSCRHKIGNHGQVLALIFCTLVEKVFITRQKLSYLGAKTFSNLKETFRFGL